MRSLGLPTRGNADCNPVGRCGQKRTKDIRQITVTSAYAGLERYTSRNTEVDEKEHDKGDAQEERKRAAPGLPPHPIRER